MKLILAMSILLTADMHAGSINIVNLVSRDLTRFTISQGDAKETFELPAGSSSGNMLVNVDTVIRCLEIPDSDKKITPKDGDVFVVFHEIEGKPQWRVLPRDPTEGIMSLRILNLGSSEVKVKVAGDEMTIEADAIREIENLKGGKLKISILDTETTSSFNPAEPSAVLSILHRKDEAWLVTFVQDL